MKKKIFVFVNLITFILLSCAEKPFTGIKFSGEQLVDINGTTEISAIYVLNGAEIPTEKILLSVDNDTTGGAVFEYGNNSVSVTVGSNKDGAVKITGSARTVTNSIWVCTKPAKTINASDRPNGFASINASDNFGGYNPETPEKVVTVSTKKDLKNYAETGGYVIYVQGMIDMSEGMLPSTTGGTTDALDKFVKTHSNGEFTNYPDFRYAYSSNCNASTNDTSSSSAKSKYGTLLWVLNYEYKRVIQLNVKSNTTIIGEDENAGIKGCAISISAVNNVAIRNLTLQDGFDPFPHHETNDGFNAQHDLIGIQNDKTSNIWIDHCTLEDTMGLITSGNGEKWQTYDGLLDIKSNCKNITVSYCIFKNHDKTMLIGSSDSDGDNKTRTITLHHNHYYNCGQRLPMARNVSLHLYNNFYSAPSSRYSQLSAVDVRKGSLIIAENNKFGSGISLDFKSMIGQLVFKKDSSTAGNKLFAIDYPYVSESQSKVEASVLANAGSGKMTVIK